MSSKRIGNTKTFKAYKRDFAKEIRNLINKQTRKEKQKFEELAISQRSRAIEDEGSFTEVSKKVKIS